NCHRTRFTSADEHVAGWVYPTSFGPHASPVADMIAGVNGIEYGGLTISAPLNPHLAAVEDSCIGCHMVDIKNDANASYSNSWMYAGGHTMKMVTTNGVDITKGCLPCHETDTFDLKYRTDRDYDGNGNFAEGVQTEVTNLMWQVLALLPTKTSSSGTVSPLTTNTSTKAQLKAAWNWNFVNGDKSKGVHNPGYAIALLKASIADLKAQQAVQTSKIVMQLPSTGQAAWWVVNTSGVQTATQTVYPGSTSWQIRGSGDIDKDGVDDLLWQLPTGQVACWYMRTNGTAKSSSLIYFGTTTWVIRGVGDIDKDGVADLIWQLPTGQVAIWFMNANGTTKSSMTIYAGTTTWKVVGVGDVNNDGVGDLVWQLPTGQVACWVMNANGTLKQGYTVLGTATAWKIRGVGDINKDGSADLIWQSATGQIICWFMNTNVTRLSGANVLTTATSWQVRGLGN
ncbi:MAG: ammonia-forming cytochrome c nitrite reductase subunit c552, partial [bacterium]